MKVAVAADHAGLSLKETVLGALRAEGHEPLDLGVHSPEAVDYPDVALWVTDVLSEATAERGVLVCGSGAGVAVAACKVPGVRAACAHDVYTAHQAVEHDDVNVLCLGARVIGPAIAEELVRTFVGARFSGEERHERRLAKIVAIEHAATGDGEGRP